MSKKKLLNKGMQIIMITLLTLSQVNLTAFAAEEEIQPPKQSTEEATPNQVDKAKDEKNPEVETDINEDQVEINNHEMPTLPQTEETLMKTEASPLAVFDGTDLSGPTALTYDIRDAEKNARTLDVSADFSADVSSTNNKVIIRLQNGLGLESAPGMVATNAQNNNWTFSSSKLPVQLQGVILNATFTPDPSVYDYTPRSGTLVYEISPGTTHIKLPILIAFDLAFAANGGSKSFDNLLEVSTQADVSGVMTTLAEEKIESYTITGRVEPLFYRNNADVTINAGDTTYSAFSLSGNGTSYTNSIGGSVLYHEYNQTFKFNKKLGFQRIENSGNTLSSEQLSYTVDSTSDPDNDIVTLTIKNFKINGQKILFHFSTATDLPPGSYITKPSEISATPYGTTESLKIGVSHSHVIVVAQSFENKLSVASNTGTIFNTPNVAETTNYPLGVYKLANNFASNVTDQKTRLTFDDPAIGVTYVQLVTGRGQAATNVQITTNKSQYYSESLALSENNSLTGVANLDLSKYTTDPDEFIKEVVYESTNYLPGSGTNGSVAVSYILWSSNPGVFYGKLLSTPASKKYISTISTVPTSDGDLDGSAAQHGTITMNVSNANNMTFRHINVVLPTLTYNAGEDFTMSTQLTLGREEISGAYTKKGFDFYLREGEYLQIDKSTIEVKQGDKVYSVANGEITPIETTDNTNNRVIKFVLNDVALGVKDRKTTHPIVKLNYQVKIKSNTPTTTMTAADLLAIIPSDGDKVVSIGNTAYFNTPNKYDVDGSGDTSKLVGTVNKDTTLKINEQKDFTVTTAANLNGGPWSSYDYYTGASIIDLNPSGHTKYQLSVANNSGSSMYGYTALVPVPKAGEQTDLTPASAADFNAKYHLQKGAFEWTTSLLEEIMTSGALNYDVHYATTYETDKDSPHFKKWDEIANKEDIRMIRISTTDEIPDNFEESIEFPLALTDPHADTNAGKMNIYSARIYRDIAGASAGYKPSEPIAIRLQTGVIKGQVFNDSNRNGIKDSDETGRNGVTVHAYEAGTTNEIEATTTKTIDGVSGSYEFLGLDKKQAIDIVFTNPTTNDETRFSQVTVGGSTPTATTDHLQATTSSLIPSATGFDQIHAGIIEPIRITLNPVDGSTSETVIKRYPGEMITTEPTAVLTGTSFKGWYDAILGGTKMTFPYTAGNEDVTLFAQYSPLDYSVTYDVDGVQVNDSVTFDTLLTEPDEPLKTGHNFTGWYDAKTGGTKWDFDTAKMPAENLTLYAQFTVADYVVTFNNEGTETTTTSAYDTLLTEPAAPTKTGHTFAGWYNAKTGGTKWDFATNKMPGNDLTLYAQYTANHYDVTFDNEGTQTKEAIVYDGLLTEPSVPTKVGYTFTGWYDAKTGGTKWDFATGKMPAGEMTLYAQFVATEYEVTFNNEEAITKQQVAYETLVTEPTPPTKVGYTFTGWYDVKVGGTKWNFTTDTMPAHAMALYAQYTINMYHVTFNDNGTETTLSATYDTLLTEPTASTKNGYTFIGWKEQLSASNWDFATDKVPARDIVLFAQFKADDQTITFDVNSGDLASQPATIVAPTDSSVDIDAVPQPTKVGYRFTGWYHNGQQISGTIMMPVGGLDLQAEWTEADQVISFNTNGGTGVASIVAKTNVLVDIDAQVTTKPGYTFIGWYDGDTQVTGTIPMPKEGLSLTAKWQAEDQTITFDVNGGDLDSQPGAIVLPTDETIDLTTIAAPTRSGYHFVGWFDGTTEVSGSFKMPAGGLNLRAEWKQIEVEDKSEQDKTPKEKEDQNRASDEQTGLPNTGESLSNSLLLGIIILLLSTFYFLKRKLSAIEKKN